MRAEFTLTRIGPERFYLVSAGALERTITIALLKLAPPDGCVRLRQGDDAIWRAGAGRPALARRAGQGRRHRCLQRRLPLADRAAAVDRRGGRLAMRVNFVGELGYEIHHPIEMQNYIFDTLMAAGRRIRHQAVRHPRDGFAAAGEILQAGRARTVDRIRRARIRARALRRSRARPISSAASAAGAWRDKGFANQLVTLEVHGVTDADARGSEPVTKDGARSAARPRAATAGAPANRWRWRWCSRIAPRSGTELEIRVLGEPRRAVVIAESPFDPGNAALRG